MAATSPAANEPSPRDRRTLGWGIIGAIVTYLAFPPVGWSWLAWIGPAAWIYLAALPQLPGRRPYRALWLAGCVFWLLTIAWLRLPHPANWAALAFVASYLGLYLPVFVALTRVAVHQVGAPLWLAAPIVWTGLELARAHLLTGFVMGALAHSQYRSPIVLQLAEYGGEYAVTFVMVMFAALIARAVVLGCDGVPREGEAPAEPGPSQMVAAFGSAGASPSRIGGPAIAGAGAVALLAATLGAGSHHERSAAQQDESAEPVRVALVQSDLLADWKGEAERDVEVMHQQTKLSQAAADKARAAGKPLDLVVWPETMYREWLTEIDEENLPPREIVDKAAEQQTVANLRTLATNLDANLLVGIDRVFVSGVDDNAKTADDPDALPYRYTMHNSSVGVTRTGEIVGHYDKTHLLPFGEYVPLVDWIPGLAWITPITGGATPGVGAKAIAFPPSPALSESRRRLSERVDHGVRYAPNICYETALPHLIRKQVHDLAERGEAPDVLVNLTNDAWYWGSAELDMHLAAGVLRAVETRTPLVIAANRGLSAHIDSLGNIVAVTKRDCADVLVADVRVRRPSVVDSLRESTAALGESSPRHAALGESSPRHAALGESGPRGTTLYVRYGDWLPGGCLVCCVVLATWSTLSESRRRSRRERST